MSSSDMSNERSKTGLPSPAHGAKFKKKKSGRGSPISCGSHLLAQSDLKHIGSDPTRIFYLEKKFKVLENDIICGSGLI